MVDAKCGGCLWWSCRLVKGHWQRKGMYTDVIKDGNREEVDEDRRKELFSSCISSVREAETLRRAGAYLAVLACQLSSGKARTLLEGCGN